MFVNFKRESEVSSIQSEDSTLPSADMYRRYDKQPRHDESALHRRHSDVSTVVSSEEESFASEGVYRKYGVTSRDYAADVDRRHSGVDSVSSRRKSTSSVVSAASTTHSRAMYRKYSGQSRGVESSVVRGHDDVESVDYSRASELSDISEKVEHEDGSASEANTSDVYVKYSRQSKSFAKQVLKQHSDIESIASQSSATPLSDATKPRSSRA